MVLVLIIRSTIPCGGGLIRAPSNSFYTTRTQGFSLLEMVVAVAILGLSLSVLYQSIGGATRIVRTDEKYAYAVELARSLLADNAVVPVAGYRNTGETSGGFQWSVDASPVELPEVSALEPGSLQYIDTRVSWTNGERRREVVLTSVVAGRDME